MSVLLSNLRNAVITGFVLAIVVFAIIVNAGYQSDFAMNFAAYILRALHILAGIMWIGLLYYFNFVQIPNMSKIPDEQKPAIGKVIAPAALFYFRWAAMATMVIGILLAAHNGYLVDALLLGSQTGHLSIIGIGMWLGLIMWFNVWFVIWPNQKKALGMVTVEADAKAKAARTAMLFSRANTVLSVPMLLCMVGQMHFG
ncbi:MAG: urate hydroxylase PuuD [Rhodospirillaceae bacterium]|nr:urate hydroxylase PuuD [Rhodospirillaceae bacterium]